MNLSDTGETNEHCNLRQQPSTDATVVSELMQDQRVMTGDTVDGGSHNQGNKWIEVGFEQYGTTVEGYVADYLIRHV